MMLIGVMSQPVLLRSGARLFERLAVIAVFLLLVEDLDGASVAAFELDEMREAPAHRRIRHAGPSGPRRPFLEGKMDPERPRLVRE